MRVTNSGDGATAHRVGSARGGGAESTARIVADRYAVLPAQGGMVYNSLRGPVGVDVVQIVVAVPEAPDPAAWEQAWARAVDRHPVLRTAFRYQADDGPFQEVYRDVPVRIDWRDVDAPIDGQLAAYLRDDRSRAFDVSVAPLFRVAILREPASRHTLVFTLHHAILDGRSVQSLFAEVFADYAAIRDEGPLTFSPRPLYRDFVSWWEKSDLTAAQAFWAEFLRGYAVPAPLAGLTELAGTDQAAEPSTVEASLDESTSGQLRAAAATAGVTTATMVNAAWAVLLGRYRGTDDVLFGVTRSCRRGTAEGAESMVGLLINTVPMRVPTRPETTVAELLDEVSRRGRAVREHQIAPLGDIQRWADLSTAALPDTLVVFERQLLQSALSLLDERFADRPVTVHRQPSFPVTLYVFDEPRLRLMLIHDRRGLVHPTADRMLRHLRQVLAVLAGDPATRLADITLADAQERASLVHTWNQTSSPYPRDATIADLFAEQVARTPDAVAVVDGRGSLTYAELDARTNQLAHLLREHGVSTDDRVLVALPRDTELVVALLAVLKAGGAYVPLDPADPPARSALVLANSDARVVLTNAQLADGAVVPTVDGVSVLALDALAADLATRPSTPSRCPARADSLAYVNYTSGSTGVPKGVAVPHRGVVRLVHQPNFMSLGPQETMLWLAAVAFDLTTLEVWGPLLNGGRLVVAPPGPVSLPQITSVLRDSGVNALWLTSGLFHQIVELDVDALTGVRQLLAGGDVLAPDAVRAALRARGGQPVINGYGPTEGTTFISCHPMTDPADVGDRVPIGRPIQQTTAYVLDELMRPAPIGVPGELYTGGDGVARGYAGRPGLTAEKFVPDPFGARPGARLYRTGDLARWRADGVLEFLGRIDGQVKIRGFRVEPGEVEVALSGRPEVGTALVLPRGDGENRHLVAWVTLHEGTERTGAGRLLREHLAGQLPDYLVPTAVVVLDELPLNANGKVDRAALPDPDATPTGGPDRVPVPSRSPTTAVETRLANLWCEILKRDRVGLDDDFFALGGNSLAATRLIFRVRDLFGVDLPVLKLYADATLAGCAAAIGALGPAGTAENRPLSGGITRRDRTAFRTAAGPPVVKSTSDTPAHIVPLASADWGLWRWVCLRSAGFPFELHEALASPALVEAADRLNATGGDELAQAYRDEYARAERVLSRGLHAVAADPRFREAVAWQNRHALQTGVDALLRRDPETVARTGRYRKYEALVASYLQRYCGKNDTIGFYGPVAWAEFRDDVDGIDLRPAPTGQLAARTVYFEGWALRALAEAYGEGLGPWLVPRRMPFVDLSLTADGAWLRVPCAPLVPISLVEAHTFQRVDGAHTAEEIAVAVLADPGSTARDADEVFRALAELHAANRIAWQLDVAPDDIHPELTVRARLARVADPARSAPTLAALDTLEAARAAVTAAASTVDPEALVTALEGLDATFTHLTGAAATRRAGETYAGRTLVFEECLRVDDVTFGSSMLEPLRAPLELVLTAARWYTAAGAAMFRRLCLDIYRERATATGSAVIPFAEFWLDANDLIFHPPDHLAGPLARALQARWSTILDLPEGARRVDLSSAALRDGVHKAFGVAQPGWPGAAQHSPDLMIAAADAAAIRSGDFQWVLGELHPGLNTLRYATWVAYHPSPDRMRAAMRDDVGRPVVVLSPTGAEGGTPARLSNVLYGPDDTQLVFAHDSSGYDPRRALFVGECDLTESDGRLLVRRRTGGPSYDLGDVLADPLSLGLSQFFRVVPRGAHTPRVTIDRLVVQRESWTFPAAAMAFAHTIDEAKRFVAARRWVTANDLPRHVFVRAEGELKPIFVDLASLASTDLLSRAVRRARRHSGDDAPVTVAEMLPGPDHLWLTDVNGQRYTSELRLCAVDRAARRNIEAVASTDLRRG